MNFQGKPAEPVHNKHKTYKSVVEYMATDLITFTADQKIEDAMDRLLASRISGAPVLNEKRQIIGMLSEKDCLRVILENAYYNMPPGEGRVSSYMSTEVVTISADEDVLAVAERFLKSHFRRFPVIDKGRLVGQVSRRDILRAAMEIKKTSWKEKAEQK